MPPHGFTYGGVAQWSERVVYNCRVVGSIPTAPTNEFGNAKWLVEGRIQGREKEGEEANIKP